MRRWLLLVACAGLLAGCSRYTPMDMSQAVSDQAPEEDGARMLEPGADGDDPEKQGGREEPDSEAGGGETLELGSGKSGSGEGSAENESGRVLRITDDDGEISSRQPVKVKGVYISAYVAGSGSMVEKIIEQIDETELNAVVIDFKDDNGRITTRVDSPAFEEIGACENYVPDMAGLIRRLKEHGIYVIARVVTFRDPYLAEHKPEWSLKNADGSLYRDKQGLAWVNPYKKEVWDYLVEVGKQASALGFDEIQFDYIRFATDAAMKSVVFDEADTKGLSRTDIVSECTGYAYDELAPLGVFVSADVFGAIIGSGQDSQAVGQDYGEMAKHLDYICPMLYPSHYADGNFGLDHPDMHPYETVLAALKKSREELNADKDPDGRQAIVRPWLQDFTASYLKHHISYKDEQIRQQIRAVKDAGYDEWILWSAANKYHYGALETAEFGE